MTNTTKSIAVLAVAMMAFVAIMSFSIPSDGTDEPAYDQDLGIMYGYVVQFVFTGSDASSVTWDFGDGSEKVTAWNPQHTYAEKGVYYVTQDAYNTFQGGSHSIATYKLTIAGYPWIDFESNGGSPVERIQMESAGLNAVPATEPSEPTKTGYTFAGWYIDAELTTPYEWDSKVTEAITLYAKWAPNTYKITFDLNGAGGSIPAQDVEFGKTVTEPSEPARSGYLFDGWFNGSLRWTFTSTVSSNMTLVAHWTEIPPEAVFFKISFDGNGGSSDFSTINCEDGKEIELPNAVREGYKFDGWFIDDTFIGGAGDRYAPASNVTLTAHWTSDSGVEPDEMNDKTGGIPWWIVALVTTIIILIAAIISRSPVAGVFTIIAALVTVALRWLL